MTEAAAAMEASARNVEEEVGKVLEQVKELQDAAAAFISKTTVEEQSLGQRAIATQSSINRVRSLIDSLFYNKLLDSKLAEKLEEDLHRAICVMDDGDVSSVLPGKPQVFAVQLYQAWLLFLYTGLAMRENILRVNGSDIRSWWIFHHYCAMIMALVSLTWEIKGQPDCSEKQRGVQLFLIWAMMQGVAMFLQNTYQRQRLYTRIAMGKAKRMDVVWGETAGVDGQLWLLCPLLFMLQGFEAYIGFLLLKSAYLGIASDWQVLFFGFLLIVMAIGNFVNTVQTLMTKSKFKAKMKRSKSKALLANTSSNS